MMRGPGPYALGIDLGVSINNYNGTTPNPPAQVVGAGQGSCNQFGLGCLNSATCLVQQAQDKREFLRSSRHLSQRQLRANRCDAS